MDASIGVNQDAFGSKPLGAVTGDGVAVIEVAMLCRLELDLPVIIQSCGNTAIWSDCLDKSEIAVSDAERFIGRGKLNSFANREVVSHFAIDADAGQPARIIGGKFPGLAFRPKVDSRRD